MDSSAEDPFPPEIMDGLDGRQMFDSGNGPASLDGNSFFNSALPLDSAEMFDDGGFYESTMTSPLSFKEQSAQANMGVPSSHAAQSRSPESFSQDSSSDSSGNRKRKSSSRSSQSPQNLVMASAAQMESWAARSSRSHPNEMAETSQQPTRRERFSDWTHRGAEHDAEVDSASSSPGFLQRGPRHVAIPVQESPYTASISPFIQPAQQGRVSTLGNQPSAQTRADAHVGQLDGDTTTVPSVHPQVPEVPKAFSSLTSPLGKSDDYINNAVLNDMHSAFSPFTSSGHAQNYVPNSSYAESQRYLNQPDLGAIFTSPNQPQQGPTSRLYVHHQPTKSRVETQIPTRLFIHPLPEGVKKLHLQRHTISKPKLLSKPPATKSADTLELYATLVRTSAMKDQTKLQRALARAAALPSQSKEDALQSASLAGAMDEDESASDGGDVQICSGCISRERKRASRKKARKPEEDELWLKDEAKRIIVFNTNEEREWETAPASYDEKTEPGNESPGAGGMRNISLIEGTMTVVLPMRVACYCRHHNEKTGFQVIFTLKDHQDRLVAQSMSRNIMITDDHKTHIPAMAVGQMNNAFPDASPHGLPNGGAFGQQNIPNYAMARNAHSATDLQGLQNGFHSRLVSPNAIPQAMPFVGSQPSSASATPHNLSRQASPSMHAAPNAKRRKASSGSIKVPESLTMTRLQTGPSGFSNVSSPSFATMGTGMASSSATTSPYNPAFSFANGYAERPVPRHRAQRSAQFLASPATPNTSDQAAFNFNHRSQSLENLAAYRNMISAPSSAFPSRAPSPAPANHNPQYSHSNTQQAPFHSEEPSSAAMNARRMPTLSEVIPNEGSKSGGTKVSCIGTGFYHGLEVKFGEATATGINFVNENLLVCLLPPSPFAGKVIVTLKHPVRSNGLQQRRFPSPPVSLRPTFFTYIDDNEQQIMNQALTVLALKINGATRSAGDVARDILAENGAAQGHSVNGSSQVSGQYHQNFSFGSSSGSLDVERAVLKCLDLIDLDDSPFPAQLNLKRRSGQTLLHLAASLGHQQLVAALLARGANPDIKDRNGMSPMHMAALNGQAQIVRRLRVAGANPYLRSLAGFVPADMTTSPTVLKEAGLHALSHPASRPLAHRGRSLPGSSVSLASSVDHKLLRSPQPDWSSSDEFEDDDESPLSISHTPARGAATPMKAGSRSRRNSITADVDLESSEMHANFVFASAMAAWRDHLAPQIQNLQPNVNWTLPNLPTLPPMPNLSDYQAYHLYRFFSSLVPQRSSFSGSMGQSAVDPKESSSRDFISDSSAPPAYEDIYPAEPRSRLDTKVASAAQAAAEAVEDEKFAAAFDRPQKSRSLKTWQRAPVVAGESILKPDLNDETDSGSVKVKRLRSDVRLFIIWVSFDFSLRHSNPDLGTERLISCRFLFFFSWSLQCPKSLCWSCGALLNE